MSDKIKKPRLTVVSSEDSEPNKESETRNTDTLVKFIQEHEWDALITIGVDTDNNLMVITSGDLSLAEVILILEQFKLNTLMGGS